MEQLAKLFELQQLEREVALIAAKLKESEESIHKQKAEDAVALQQKQLARIGKNVSSCRKALRALEDRLASVEAEAQQIEQRLFGGEVQNPKELAALQENLNATKHKKNELEELVLEEMERLEEYNAKLEASELLGSKLRKVLDAATLRWTEAQAERETQISKLRGEGEKLRETIDPALLGQYDELRERFEFRVVAQVQERRCSGCHVMLPTSVKMTVGGRCPNCDRLLWWV